MKTVTYPERMAVQSMPTSKTVVPVSYPEKVPAAPAAPVASAVPSSSQRTVTVKGPNGVPEQCRVLKEWLESDGSKHCQLQVIATGETMTMVEPRGSALKPSGSSLFHWGSRDTSSQDMTGIPPGAVVTSTTIVKNSAPSMPHEQVVTIRELNLPPQKCRVLKTWTEKDGSKASQIQAIDTYEIMTMVQPSSSMVDGKPTVTRVYRWKSIDKAPAGSPIIPSNAVVVGMVVLPAKPGLLSRMFGSSKTESTTVMMPSQPAMPAATTAPPQAVAQTTPEQPKDWRQSWGKTEKWSADDSNKAVAQSSSRADQTARPSLPLAEKSVDDPLKKPQDYVKTLPSSTMPATPEPLKSMPPGPADVQTATTNLPPALPLTPPPSLTGNTTASTETPAPTALAPLSKPAVPDKTENVPPPRPSLWSMLTNRSTDPAKAAEKTPATTEAPKSNVALGMGSVMAAGSPSLNRPAKPIGQMTIVDGQQVMRPPMRNAFRVWCRCRCPRRTPSRWPSARNPGRPSR